MKKITRMVEEVTGYEAADGAFFRSEEECKKYEQSAFCAAQKTAETLKIKEMLMEDAAPFIGGYEERVVAYDIKTAGDLQVLNTWLDLEDTSCEKVDPKYIGKRVVVQYWVDSGHSVLGSREDIEATFKKNMDKLFNEEQVS